MESQQASIPNELRERIARIRLLAVDSDGVLTDGGVYVADDGHEFRRFDIKDGLGLKMLMEAGIEVAIISSATSSSVLHRAAKLGIKDVYLGVTDKLKTLEHICECLDITFEQVVYMGDDLPDLPVLKCVGLPCAPSNAVEEVKQVALYVARQRGGDGAIREVSEWICEQLR